VLFVIWPRPLVTTGSGTFVDELIRLVGARGAFDDLDEPWPTVSMEVVLERDPDLIVIASEDAGGPVPTWIGRHPLWGRLSAVRDGRVHLVDGDLFNRPGPRMDDAAAELAGYVRALEGHR
jgi:iron complex transport system substrate-binding protein